MASWSHLCATIMVCLVSVAFLIHSSNGQTCGAGTGQSCGDNACCSEFGYCGRSLDSCGAGCQLNYGACAGSNCFPASAMVTTRGGITKPISALSIGEEVPIRNSNGLVEYDTVYALGHSDARALSQFIVLTLLSLQDQNMTQILQLTPHHFTIVQGLKNTLEYKLASDVKVGDRMLAIHNNHDLDFSTFIVSGINTQMMRGLYKPLTLSGTIVVNNVLASCHSQWSFHSTLESIFGRNTLPSINQAIFTPIRMAYTRMDRGVYKAICYGVNSHTISRIIAKLGQGLKGSFKILMGDLSAPVA